MGVSEGEFPLRIWKKNAIFKINLQNLVHISFANILLKIHHSFPMKYWLLLCLFLPTFHFSFIMFMILAIITSIPLTFPLPNCYKLFFSIEGKTDLSEGRMPPQKLTEIMQISKFARVHVAIPTRRKFDKFLVRHGVSPTTQISYTYEYRMRQSKTKCTCASPKKKRCYRPKLGKQSLPDSCYVLLKTCRTSGWFSFAQFGAYLLPTFYWKSIIHFQQNTGYYYVYSSQLSIFLLW